jgi:hypothetical protein
MTDKRFEADGLAEYGRRFLSSGVWALVTNLQVSAGGGMTVIVNYGEALVDGYPYRVRDNGTGQLTFTLEDADATNPRIDRVVVRKDPATLRISAYIKAGTAEASPSAPPMEREDEVFEISLGRLSVAAGATVITEDDITDEREDADVCGLVENKLGTPIAGDAGNIPVYAAGGGLEDGGKALGDLVSGANESADNQVARMSGVTGKVIKGSPVTIDDEGNVNIPTGKKYKINGVNFSKSDVDLSNVTNNAQMKKIPSSVSGNLIKFADANGDTPADSGIPALGLKREILTLTKSGDQTVSSTSDTVITWDTVATVGGTTLLERNGNTIRAKVNCYVRVSAVIGGANVTISYVKIRIKLNGNTLTQILAPSVSGSSAYGGMLNARAIAVSSGDYFEAEIQSGDSSYYVASGEYCFFEAEGWAR